MFRSPTSLPHRLSAQAYWSEEQYQRELPRLQGGWQLVGHLGELSRAGDFITCSVLGQAVQVRNFNGQLRALSNVCAHRHCLLSHQRRGHSPSMRCQYHGWEYGSNGRPCKIPEPKNFVPFPRETMALPAYAVDCAGQLVFVRLGQGPSLAEQLGPVYPLCQQFFGPDWKVHLDWRPDYPANWKVPVENSLEAYHVPCVHPHTFGQDPGEQRSRHEFFQGGSSFSTRLPFAHTRLDAAFQRCEGWVVRRLGASNDDLYHQYHIFPNLLFSFTSASSFVQCVLPTGAATSRALVLQFARRGGWLGPAWGSLKAALTLKILREDLGLFRAIQEGLQASPHTGLLGRCEERIHAFQDDLLA
ncbi:MAG: aromatic ring-hydroxylating dioxygenase subunit alpha [Vulcanimicrobiota bacterium]